MSLLPARMKKIQLKINVLKWPQHFSHYKSMEIFQDAQGQLTPQSMIGDSQNSNSSEMLWLSSLLPARMKKIRTKIKALKWPQYFPYSLLELSVALETRVLIRSGPKPNAAFPPSQ